MRQLVISFQSNDRPRRRFAPLRYGLTGGPLSGLPRPARYQQQLVPRPLAESCCHKGFFRIDGAVAISEARSVPGCAKFTFLPPIGGYPREGWLLGGIGRLDGQKEAY